MKHRNRFFTFLALFSFACVLNSVAQNRDSIPPNVSPKHPVNIQFKNGEQFPADLIHNDPANPEAIVVEIAGLRRSVLLDDLMGIREDARKFDEYHAVAFNDEKARLDNYAIEMQNDPGVSAYIASYGKSLCEGQARADRAKEYLVNSRGIDDSRIVALGKGCQTELLIELWVVPRGASQPPAAQTVACAKCPRPPRKKGGSRRGR